MNCILSPHFCIFIIKKVEKYISRSLTETEETNVIKLIKNIKLQNTSNISQNKLSQLIIDTIIEDLNFKHCSENVDIHEIMLNEINNNGSNPNNLEKEEKEEKSGININSLFGINNITQLTKIINEINNPEESNDSDKEYTAYLLLDSKYRFLENDGTEYYKWGSINNYISSQGTVNHTGKIKNIKSMELAKFILPDIKNSNIFKYDRLTILINEFESQSFIGHENRRFHFIAHPEVLKNNKIEIEPHYFHNGNFEFKNPITSLDTLTITFGNPLEKIKFDKDRLDGKFIIENVNNKDVLLIKFEENHTIKSGDYIYIDTFDKKIQNKYLKNNCDYINLINMINRSSGLQCFIKDCNSIYLFNSNYNYEDCDNTEIYKNNFICINSDIKDNLSLNNKYNVFFGSKRLFLTLSLTYSL